MLKNSFPRPLVYKVDCYLGEDRKGKRGLHFTLDCKPFGRVYSKFEYMLYGQTVDEFEDEFMNKVINDLVLAGVTFLNMEAHGGSANQRVADDIEAPRFKSRMPQKLLFIN
jgi:hypothetical protein